MALRCVCVECVLGYLFLSLSLACSRAGGRSAADKRAAAAQSTRSLISLSHYFFFPLAATAAAACCCVATSPARIVSSPKNMAQNSA